MSSLNYAIVDAFTQVPFKGNGAAVVVLDSNSQFKDELLQAIAAEFNLSETAFTTPINKDEGKFFLRWFTPKVEVGLCGHATLATAHVLFSNRKSIGLADNINRLEFQTKKAGILTAQLLGDGRIELDFPAGDIISIHSGETQERIVTAIKEAFHPTPPAIKFIGDGKKIYDDYLLVEIDPNYDLQGASVNTDAFKILASAHQIIVVSQSATGNEDFKSRVFAPATGVQEDPVTGSAHSFMASYWQKAFGKDQGTEIRGQQVSLRSGDVGVVVHGDMCKLRGHATLAAKGEFFYPSRLGFYAANVQVGLGNYTLIVDSGSAYTWVGANLSNPYLPSPESIATGENVSVPYGSGNFTGFKFIDTVVIDNIVIKHQQIGVANLSFGFEGVDGILGIGPPDRTFNTTGTDPFILVPTVTDEMLMQGIIDVNITGVALSPLTTPDFELNGEVTFGGIDPTKFIGNLTFVPTTDKPPASTFWGIEQSVTIGDSHTVVIPPGTPGIMDTAEEIYNVTIEGTTLLFLATPFLNTILNVTGAVFNDTLGIYQVDSLDSLQSLFYNIGGVSNKNPFLKSALYDLTLTLLPKTIFELTPNAQIFPPQFNILIGGQEGVFYLLFADLGDEADIPAGPGMMRHYVTYDGTRKVVGVAQTKNTFT
ncbi:hypothetical protein Clacol_008380 [Clathrus columnatus]|uniref:Peptidase A1 domain-containing protein n=1 Tax=Clathrus columnatus TaxID=1419009 RepID=A0AAV5AM10_9AGAM|nr:hypothetical protein Clacol_008380 [Clathrus columnatus]